MIRLDAPAKINLFLEITGRRADGYHTLDTVFQTISLHDELTFRPSRDLRLTGSGLKVDCGPANLVYRAAAALREALREPRGARIHLKKGVPMGAGLGGGSSDAAMTLLGLLKLWKRRIEGKRLLRLAASLGADVPFFIRRGTAWGRGIGDTLSPIDGVRPFWAVLVYPGFGVPTKEAYQSLRHSLTSRRSSVKIRRFLGDGALPGRWSPLLFNRFEEAVFPKYPDLPRLKSRLLEAGARGVLMSGSGSSIFGVVSSRAQGERLLRAVRKRYPQSWLVRAI